MRRLIVNTFGFQCQMIPVFTTLAGFGKVAAQPCSRLAPP